jgi:hypothetical protein
MHGVDAGCTNRQAISTAHWERTLKATVVVDLPDGGNEFTSAAALNEFLDVVNHDRSEAEVDEARAKRRTAVLLCERSGELVTRRRQPLPDQRAKVRGTRDA